MAEGDDEFEYDDMFGEVPEPKEEGSLGSRAFGVDSKGRPTGSAAFGGGDLKHPLRGALLFGNDPEGKPRGSEAVGGPDVDDPLRGALLFGNDPQGEPRGAEAFGSPETAAPLKGALLFGNDPKGEPRGSEAFGNSDPAFQFRGSAAVGAPQLLPEKLFKDEIGYDFGGTMLSLDEGSIAGIRKNANDSLRQRVLNLLHRYCGCEVEKLRSGLNEHSIPWGRLKRDTTLDRKLADELRTNYQKAPGSVLGIGHVRDVLEVTERMHTFDIHCDWDLSPLQLSILRRGQPHAYAQSAWHKEHAFLVFRDLEKQIISYVDLLYPRKRQQKARVRTCRGQMVGAVQLKNPAADAMLEMQDPARMEAVVLNAQGEVMFRVLEQRASKDYFRASLLAATSDEVVGKIEDRLAGGKIRTHVEVDLPLPSALVWGFAAIFADLARLRRRGWPNLPETEPPPEIETIEQALGPRKRRKPRF